MSIRKAVVRIGVGIVLTVAATAAIGQTNPVASVKIGNLTWTKQNINIEAPNSWCYGNSASNCEKYGRLYTWDAAKKACLGLGGKWRLPTDEDWDNLMKAAGGVRFDEEMSFFYTNAGKKLKSKSGWNNKQGKSGNGTDDYGFSALPGGDRGEDGSFSSTGNVGYWWSASGGDFATGWGMSNGSNGSVDASERETGSGLSVRCVQE